MKLRLVILALCVFAVSCGSDQTTRADDGEITESGDLGVFSVQVGDCVNVPDESEVSTFEGVSCDTVHDAQVFALFDIVGFSEYPGQEMISERAGEGCLERFEGFVGMDYDNSIWYFNNLTPTEESWDRADDREVICVLLPPEGETLTQDLEGIAT